MANEIFKELKTRIALKQNTYQYWVNGEGKDYIPLYGEVCFCEIPAGSGQATNAPTMLFKVGTAKKDAEGNWVEGTNKTFSQLNWVSALAADVYSWAKKTEADFITWVNTVVQHPAPTVDTNTVYRVVKVNELNYKLQSKSAFDADTAWVDVQGSTITIPESTKVEASGQNGYIKVDGEEVQVYDEIFGVDMATVNALGGIAAGTNLKDKTIHEVLNALLFPYVKPVVGSPSRVPSTTSPLEKGDNQTITSVSVTVTKKSEPITKVELLRRGEVIAIKEGDGVKNGGKFTFSGLSISAPSSSVSLSVRVTDAKGTVVTSGSTAAWTFVYPYFYGVCAGNKTAATLTESDIEAMTKDIKAKGEKSYTYTTNNQKMVIAYPKAYGVLRKALDPNGFDYLGDYERAELNITGLDGSAQAYYIYAQKAPSFVTSFTMKYQY